jgi:malonyl-CoA O-methyltransferase
MSGDDSAYALDQPTLRRSFDRAAPTYDGAAVLQAEVREALMQRLELTALTPRVIVDAGAGTGHASRALKRRYPRARVIALDSSPGMLRIAARRQSWFRPVDVVCADAERLPLADAGVDLILSNFMLPSCDPDRVFAEFRRVLAPHGFLTFTSLGPDTLRELRAAWGETDTAIHVHRFIDMHDLGDALVRAGFAAPVLDVERYTLNYAAIGGLMADLKSTGARNAAAGRRRGLTGTHRFRAMQSAYETFRGNGVLPATYEVVFGQAWAPAAAAQRRAPASSDSEISLEEVRRELQRLQKP